MKGDLTYEDSAHEIRLEFFLEVTPVLSFLRGPGILVRTGSSWGSRRKHSEIMKQDLYGRKVQRAESKPNRCSLCLRALFLCSLSVVFRGWTARDHIGDIRSGRK